jgi:hypothetical protein
MILRHRGRAFDSNINLLGICRLSMGARNKLQMDRPTSHKPTPVPFFLGRGISSNYLPLRDRITQIKRLLMGNRRARIPDSPTRFWCRQSFKPSTIKVGGHCTVTVAGDAHPWPHRFTSYRGM